MARLISFDELERHNRQDNLWILINDKVYNISQYMKEHPGGEEVLLAVHGEDATHDFDDIGHSDEAKELMKNFYIGDIDQLTVPYLQPPPPPSPSELIKVGQESGSGNKAFKFLVPILIIVISIAALLILNKYKQQD